MVKVFKPARRGNSKSGKPASRSNAGTQTLTVTIDGVDHQGQGVCSSHQPVIFVSGGLPGERCEVDITRQDKRVWHARVKQVLQPSPARVAPFCALFGECGGCQTQYADTAVMLDEKQQALSSMLTRKAGLTTLPWQPALTGPSTGYRRKTRLAVDARRPQAIRVGFRQQGASRVVAVHDCAVLTAALQALLTPLQALIAQLHNAAAIGHITLLDADNLTQVCVRITRDLSQQDQALLKAFADENQCQLLLETNDGALHCLSAVSEAAVYSPQPGIMLEIGPNDFVQVNAGINQAMVEQALNWLAPKGDDAILDLFCGVGNFSLPLARDYAQVTGIEGVAKMVQAAQRNAQRNGIHNAAFACADLNDAEALRDHLHPGVSHVLLDPAREGARGVMPMLAARHIHKVLYVSCNPATLVRDAAELLASGYHLQKIGLMDMFPNTAHTEVMALFVRDNAVPTKTKTV